MKKLLLTSAIFCGASLFGSNYANATWVGVVGFEHAKTVQATSKKEVQQVELILNGMGKEFAGLTWDNTTAVKMNREANMFIARNWAYGYWNENYRLSVDLIKGDWGGTGPNIGAVGLAYKNCFDKLCFRLTRLLQQSRINL